MASEAIFSLEGANSSGRGFRKRITTTRGYQSLLGGESDLFICQEKLKRPLNEYDHVAYVFVARDFFFWPDSDDLLLADYDVFKDGLSKTADLAALISKLKSYDWLPVEGRDFRVAMEPLTFNGIMLESETFYRI